MLDIGRFTADMPNLNQIKSMQIVTIPYGATDLNVTINSVVVENSIILAAGVTGMNTNSAWGIRKIYLSGATTLAVEKDGNALTTFPVIVIEFNSFAIKSRQTGTITNLSGGTSSVITISAVNPINCIPVAYYIQYQDNATSGFEDRISNAVITSLTSNALTISNTQASASYAAESIYWEILELR